LQLLVGCRLRQALVLRLRQHTRSVFLLFGAVAVALGGSGIARGGIYRWIVVMRDTCIRLVGLGALPLLAIFQALRLVLPGHAFAPDVPHHFSELREARSGGDVGKGAPLQELLVWIG